MELRVTSGLRIQAVRARFFGLPSAKSVSHTPLSCVVARSLSEDSFLETKTATQ